MTTEPDLTFGDEPLLPELQRFVFEDRSLGEVFHHPLYISAPYFPMENKRINQVIPWRQKRIEEWKAAREWTHILAMHERPYRFESFVELEPLMSDEEYWAHVSWLWTDSNNIHQHLKGWRRIWLSKRPGRDSVMTDEERAKLAALPDQIPVFRGTCYAPEGCRGMAWTLRRDIAERFAFRGAFLGGRPKGSIPYLVTATVRKRDVLAYFDDRDEAEIVVLPDKARNAKTSRLPSLNLDSFVVLW